MYQKTKKITVLSLLLTLLFLPVLIQETFASEETKDSTIKLTGYVSADFNYEKEVSSQIKSGFKVEVNGLKLSSVTNENGYFEINDVPRSDTGYSLIISKPNYLKRVLTDIITPCDSYVQHELKISTSESPILIYAGDMVINGEQDNAINLRDIVAISHSYNATAKDERYNSDTDLNKDEKVNMEDVLIVANHFNTYIGSCRDDVTPLPGILYLNAVDSDTVEVTFSRSIGSLDKDKFSVDGLTIYGADLKQYTDNVFELQTDYQTSGEIYTLKYDGNEYKFTGAPGRDEMLKSIKVSGLSAQYMENNHGIVKVSWEALTKMQQWSTAAEGYKIFYYSNNDKSNLVTVPVTDINSNSMIIGGLNVKKSYNFAICAINQTAESQLSEYVTATDELPASICTPIQVSALSNNEVAVAFDNEVSKCNVDDFSINSGLKINSIRLMDGSKKIIILSTQNQIPGYTYMLNYKNKLSFKFTGTELNSSSMKPEALSSKTIRVRFGTNVISSELKVNEFVVKDQSGKITNVLSAKFDESDFFRSAVILTLSSDIKQGVVYTLKHKNLTENLTLKNIDTEKPTVNDVLATDKNEVIVKFSEPICITGSQIEISEIYGAKSKLLITDVKYRGRDALALTVENMRSSTLYSAAIKNITDLSGNTMEPCSLSFVGISSDAIPQTFDDPEALRIINVQMSDSKNVIAEFSKSLDPNTVILNNFKVREAYGAKEPLTISSVRMAKKGDIGKDGNVLPSDEIASRFVILTIDSSNMYGGWLYKLEGENLYSTEGASISQASNDSTFVGIGSLKKRITAITSIEYIGTSDTEILVSFDQDVGYNATDVSHYSISGDVGYPEKAEFLLDQPNKVKLIIPKLYSGKIYTLTVKNLVSTDGIPIYTQGVSFIFVGKGHQNQLPQMAGVVSVDNQTIKIFFDRDVRDGRIDGPIWDSKSNTLVDKALSYSENRNTPVDLEDMNEYVYQDSFNREALIVRIDARSAFNAGYLRLIGDPLKFSADGRELQLAPNAVDPASILVDNVVALNSMTVRVYFNMPVYGTLDTFADINSTSDYGTSSAITLSNPSAVDETRKVFDFKLSSALKSGIYYLNLNPEVGAPNDIIKDKQTAGIGYVGMKDEDPSAPGLQQLRLFAGTTNMPADIKDVYAVMTDEKTIKIYYPCLMNKSDVENPANYSLVSSSLGATPLRMGYGPGLDFSAALDIGRIIYDIKDNAATITLNTPILKGTAAAYILFNTNIHNAVDTAQVKDGSSPVIRQFAINMAASKKVAPGEATYNADTGKIVLTMNQEFKTSTDITGTDAAVALAGIKITVKHAEGEYVIRATDVSTVTALDINNTEVTDSSESFAKKIIITLTPDEKERLSANTVGKVELLSPTDFIGINGNSGDNDTSLVFAI